MSDKNFQTSVQLILQSSMAGRPHHEHVLSLGATPAYLIEYAGFLALELVIKGSAVVITFEMKDGAPILIPLHANKMVGRSQVNVVASVYNKEATVEQRWTNAGLKLWSK